jgi:hypothetical protein
VTDGGPDWIRDALRQTRAEVVLFLRTVRDFSLHPWRFGREWTNGQRHPLNPLGFLATAFAVMGPTRAAFIALVGTGTEERTSMWLDALGALLPFAYYLLLGALEHLVLRVFGSRQPLRDSLAMALYAGGGPASAITLLMLLVGLVLHLSGQPVFIHGGSHGPIVWVVLPLVTLSFTAFCYTLASSLAGAHPQTRWWHILIANLFALTVSALLFGFLNPPGTYGLHLALRPLHDATGWHINFGLQD